MSFLDAFKNLHIGEDAQNKPQIANMVEIQKTVKLNGRQKQFLSLRGEKEYINKLIKELEKMYQPVLDYTISGDIKNRMKYTKLIETKFKSCFVPSHPYNEFHELFLKIESLNEEGDHLINYPKKFLSEFTPKQKYAIFDRDMEMYHPPYMFINKYHKFVCFDITCGNRYLDSIRKEPKLEDDSEDYLETNLVAKKYKTKDKLPSNARCEIDHIHPYDKGGWAVLNNGQILSKNANVLKGADEAKEEQFVQDHISNFNKNGTSLFLRVPDTKQLIGRVHEVSSPNSKKTIETHYPSKKLPQYSPTNKSYY